MTNKKIWAIVPAAGLGLRMNNTIPKQYLKLGEKTILEISLTPFLAHPKIHKTFIALHKDDQFWQKNSASLDPARYSTLTGGETRAHSVLNALNALSNEADENDWIIVHDAVRPFITTEDISQLVSEVEDHEVGGIYGIPVSDTLKIVSDHIIERTQARDGLWRAQTPQMFRYGILQQALGQNLAKGREITDEASAVENLGYFPKIIMGKSWNIKITTPEDWLMAQLLMRSL